MVLEVGGSIPLAHPAIPAIDFAQFEGFGAREPLGQRSGRPLDPARAEPARAAAQTGLYPLGNRATLNPEPRARGGARKEGPYRAVGPSPVQSISAYCSLLQSRRRK